MLVERSKP